jgi:hypothetical protein
VASSLSSDALVFLWSYLSHWQSYATGGIVTGLINAAERISSQQIPKRAYVLIFVVSFSLVAFFMAWRDEFTRANTLERENIVLSTQNKQIDAALKDENNKNALLSEKIPSEASLKIRATQAADEMERFFRSRARHEPTCTQTGKMTPEEQRAVIAPCAKYTGETWDQYAIRFAPKVIAMVEEFRGKGINVKDIETCAAQGFCGIAISVQLRAFAAQLDAKDNVKR